MFARKAVWQGQIRLQKGVVRRGMNAFLCKAEFGASEDFFILILEVGYEDCDDF